MKSKQPQFNDETTFNANLKELLKKQVEEKLPDFFEYCILTRDFTHIRELFELLESNHF